MSSALANKFLPTAFLLCFFLLANAEAKETKVRNILLIMADDLKASALPAYGNKICQTPNIDRLASSGVVFERAYCQGLACAPSRPSMMRSLYPRSKATALTLGEHLQKQGFHTARVGKIFHMPVPHAQLDGSDGQDVAECWTERYNTTSAETFSPGLYRLLNADIVTRRIDGRDAKGPNRMWATVESAQTDGSDQADYLVASKAIELLRERKQADRPFFLGVGFVRPHFPMVQPKAYFDQYPHDQMSIPPLIPGDIDDIPPAGRGADGKGLNEREEGRRRMWQAYYGSVSFMDTQLGRVLDELEQLGLRETTAIVFTTDHGYHLGEHGFWKKSNLHEEIVHIPFIISAPGIKPGRTSSFVELIDFYPTCTALLGVRTPAGLHGLSLLPILHDPKITIRDSALSIGHQGGGGLRSAQWHYMRYGDGSEELYDMLKDPRQYSNLVNNKTYLAVLQKQRQTFEQRMAAAK